MTKIVKLYNGEVTIEFNEARHCYVWVEKNLPVRAVSKILGILDKPALKQWAANCAVEAVSHSLWETLQENGPPLCMADIEDACKAARTAYLRVSKEATDIGSQVHAFCEQVLIEGDAPLPANPKAAKGAQAFLNWLDQHTIESVEVEQIVMSRQWYYAGTPDYLGFVDGEFVVLDFKTSSNYYPEMKLQCAAYAIAYSEESGQEINTGWIIRLDKKTGKFFPYKLNLTAGTKDTFLRLCEAQEGLVKIEGETDGIRQQAA